MDVHMINLKDNWESCSLARGIQARKPRLRPAAPVQRETKPRERDEEHALDRWFDDGAPSVSAGWRSA